MKISSFLTALTAACVALTLTPALGQQQRQPTTGAPVQQPPELVETLSTFNLDFPGGTAKQLVAAIEKASGKPLNVIVPEEFADFKLPALKMKNVDIFGLFEAIEVTGRSSPGKQFAFGGGSQRAIGDPVWTFYVPSRPAPAKVCRFYSLASYVEAGLSVDDITTAIQTGWKMLGEENPPKISFHKDTKLLIAVGEPSKLEIIDAVLNSLKPPPTAKTPEKPKAEKGN